MDVKVMKLPLSQKSLTSKTLRLLDIRKEIYRTQIKQVF